MNSTAYKLWFVLTTLVIVLVGCGQRQPADLEAEAEKHFAKLGPLAKEVKTLKANTLADKAAYDSKADAAIEALTLVEKKLATLLGTPAPTPDTLPTKPDPPAKPDPPPAKPDPPPPKLTLPPGEFNVSNDVREWVQTLVPPEGRATGLAHFIRASKAIAADCESGKITGWNRIALVGSIKEAIGRENASIPPDVLVYWKSFAAKFNARANELFNAGRLTTPAHWKTLLDEVVIGLEAART